jgi:cephalosporin hydroxylase
MKLSIDTSARTFERDGERFDLYGKEAFEALSDLWLELGWNQKYTYTFTWLGVPIIQLPEDMIRYQEVVFRLQPDVIVETGIAHGGSAVFSASLCRLIGRGRVIAVDIDIRPHNRRRLDAHPLRDLITLIEGSSTSGSVVHAIEAAIRPGESVLVVLDSDHSKAHVAAELEAYAGLVSPGSYIVATDGLMRDLTEVPRGKAAWAKDNPAAAAREFAARNPKFVIEQPPWPFNESALARNVTHWPDAWLKRIA